MKIIQTYSWPRQTPCSQIIENRIKELARRGHTIEVLVHSSNGMAQRLNRPENHINVQTSRFALGSSLTLPVKIQKMLSENHDSMTVIHCPTLQLANFAIMASKATGSRARIILEPRLGIPPKDDAMSRLVLSQIDALILPSQTDADILMGSGACISAEKVHVLYPGVSLPDKIAVDNTHGKECSDGLTLIWAGEITPGCGLDTLVEALGSGHRMKIKLIVCGQGQGRYVMPIIRRSRSLGIAERIEWAGDTAPTPSMLEKADGGLITAPHDPDAIAAAAHYMAYGLPVIWADGTLAREFVMPDVNGIISGHGIDDWRDAIHSLIHDSEKQHQLANDVRSKAKAQFDIQEHINQLTKIYLGLGF
ncbi:MAG: glycosyltransferase family 4 protein [Muribaculaceae bacterium]|nr:glycosyltransferase family 4 protein [Muribaculaceae bacterium]